MIGTYSLVTGGQTYSNSFTYTLETRAYIWSYSRLSSVGYPNSISLNSLGGAAHDGAGGFVTGSAITNVTASNGFHMNLYAGVWLGGSDYFETFIWYSPPVTATLAITNPPIISSQPQSQTG